MPAIDIPYSCPHFDEAKEKISECDTLLDKITDLLYDAESEIEEARRINSSLRVSAEDWQREAESRKEEVEELEGRIADLEQEVEDLRSAIADIE